LEKAGTQGVITGLVTGDEDGTKRLTQEMVDLPMGPEGFSDSMKRCFKRFSI